MALIGGAKSLAEIKATIKGGFMAVMRVGSQSGASWFDINPGIPDHLDDLSSCDSVRTEVHCPGVVGTLLQPGCIRPRGTLPFLPRPCLHLIISS